MRHLSNVRLALVLTLALTLASPAWAAQAPAAATPTKAATPAAAAPTKAATPAASPTKYASIQVSVKKDDEGKATGIRTLYVTVFESTEPTIAGGKTARPQGRPMPLGAVKIDLKKDAKGEFYTGEINSENLQRMNPNAPVPGFLKIKARLDKDGQAGPDQPGDLTGVVEQIKLGDKVAILIDKTI